MTDVQEETNKAVMVLSIISNVLNVISSLCCLGIIILYILSSNTRSFATSIVFQLCVWCLISHFIVLIINPAYLTDDGKENLLCQMQGVFLTTFDTALLLWSTLIFTISLLNFKNPKYFQRRKISSTIITSLIGWFLPIIWGLIFVGDYICVFQGHVLTTIDAWKNLIFYIITIISILLLIKEVRSVLFKSRSKNKKKSDEMNLRYSNYFKRLMIYFFAQLIVFGPFSVSRFLDIMGHSEVLQKTMWWNFVKEILLCSTGMVFSMIYGYMNVKFKGEIQRIWNKENVNSSQTLIKLDDFDRAVADDLSSDAEDVEYNEVTSCDDSMNIFM